MEKNLKKPQKNQPAYLVKFSTDADHSLSYKGSFFLSLTPTAITHHRCDGGLSSY